jgi:hypothetical protein
MSRHLPIALISAAAAVALLLGACGDDDNAAPSPTASGPTPTPRVTQAANETAIAAAEAYLTSEGIDGEKGEFTVPLNCADLTDDSPGKFCVHDSFSTYAPGLVILNFAHKVSPDDNVWVMRLAPDGGDWQVTSAEPFELSE